LLSGDSRAGLTRIQTDRDARVSEFLWVPNSVIKVCDYRSPGIASRACCCVQALPVSALLTDKPVL
jgi:hypothetical protein